MKQRGNEFKSPGSAGTPDSPGNAKKKRRTSTAGPGQSTTPPTIQPPPLTDFIPPPPMSGFGESIVASNPFDDTPPPVRMMPPIGNRGIPSPQLNMDLCSPQMMSHHHMSLVPGMRPPHMGSPSPDYPFSPRQMGPMNPVQMGPGGLGPGGMGPGGLGPGGLGPGGMGPGGMGPGGIGPGPMSGPMGPGPQHRGMGGPCPDQMVSMNPGGMGHGPMPGCPQSGMGVGHQQHRGMGGCPGPEQMGPMNPGGMGQLPPNQMVSVVQMKSGPDTLPPSGGMPPNSQGMNGMIPVMGMGGNQPWSAPSKPLPIQSGKVYPHDQPMVHNPQNPNAPPIYPCGVCHKEVHDNDQAITCESGCNFFFHRICTGLSEAAYHLLMQEIYAEWVCDACLNTRSVPLVKYKP